MYNSTTQIFVSSSYNNNLKTACVISISITLDFNSSNLYWVHYIAVVSINYYEYNIYLLFE